MFDLKEWKEALEDFLNRNRTKWKTSTLQWYAFNLRPLLDWVETEKIPLRDFRHRHFDRFLNQRGESVQKTTLRAYGRCARMFFRFCYRDQLTDVDVLKDYLPVKDDKPNVAWPKPEELQKVLRSIEQRADVRVNGKGRHLTAAQRRFFRTRDYALITGLLSTGCRVSELCNLTLDDLDLKARTATFRNTKNGEDHTVAITDTWIEAVEKWLKVRPVLPDCNTVFVTFFGNAMDRHTARKRLHAYEKFAGVKLYSPHSLRRYTLTQVAKVNTMAATRLANHSDPKITIGYLEDDPEWVRTAAEQANVLGNLLEPQPVKPARERRRRIA